MPFRPRVEVLEARDVPAGSTFTWTNGGGDGVFTNPDNWIQDDDKPVTVSPQEGADFLEFDGSITQAPCVGLTGSYGAIYIHNFTSIYLGGDVQTGILDLAGGEIWNTANGQDITVTEAFNWTAGTINASTYSGALNIDGSSALDGVAGATALIAPVGGGTVYCGSNISLTNGAHAVFKDGEINFTGNNGIIVNAFCSANIKPENFDVSFSGVNPAGVDGRIAIATGGKVTAERVDKTKPANWSTGLPIEVSGGLLQLLNGITVTVGGTVGPAGQTGSVRQSTGGIQLENGSNLAVTNGLYLAGGELSTLRTNTATQVESKITGNMTNAGATINLGVGNPLVNEAHKFSVLRATGDVTWSAGAYRPFVGWDPNNNKASDQWISDGTFTITSGANGAKIGPEAVVNVGNHALANEIWTILTGATVTLSNNAMSLNFETQGQAGDWENVKEGTTKINLKHK